MRQRKGKLKSTTVKFTNEDLQIIRRLQRRLGLGMLQVIRLAIARLADLARKYRHRQESVNLCRVLVIDDFEPWRRFLRLTLPVHEKLQVVGEGCDGLEAVQKAQELRPDLILLDIGLPTLNGIEVAQRIREVSPNSKILFVSEMRDRDIAEQALSTGAGGYVLKSQAARELLPAVNAVLEGKRFVSTNLALIHLL